MATAYPVLRWKIGGVTISRVVEIEGSAPGSFFFKQATPERHAGRPAGVLGTHFATPTGGRIARDGNAFRFKP